MANEKTYDELTKGRDVAESNVAYTSKCMFCHKVVGTKYTTAAYPPPPEGIEDAICDECVEIQTQKNN